MSISILIAAVDRGAYIAPTGVRWDATLGARGTAGFDVNVPLDNWEPTVGENIQVFDGGAGVFGGSIDEVTRKRLGNDGGYKYNVQCVSNERKIDKRVITPRAYVNQDAGDIFADIIATTLSGEAIGIGNIQPGATISRIVYDYTNAKDALDDLAIRSNYVWYLDTGSQAFFVPRSTYAAPFTLTGAMIRRADTPPVIRTTRADTRTRQWIRVNFAAFAPEIETFVGDDVTQAFALARPVNRIESIAVTTSGKASVAGTFTGVPDDADTIVANGVTYTFRTTINNDAPNEVLIGADAAACATNFREAVNGLPLNKGVDYSLATSPHPNVETTSPSGGGFSARFKISGTVGNGITVSESCANFTWADTVMAGGGDGTSVAQEYGVLDVDSAKPWYYSPGETAITQDPGGTPLSGTEFLEITYRPLGGDVMGTQDDAEIAARSAVEGNTGITEMMLDDSQNVDAVGALAKAQAILDAYKSLPTTVDLTTDVPGILPGMLLPVTAAKPLITGDWLVQTISASYVPGSPHFRYTLGIIDQTRVATWLQAWEQLAKKGSGSSTSAAASTVSSPVITSDVITDRGAVIAY